MLRQLVNASTNFDPLNLEIMVSFYLVCVIFTQVFYAIDLYYIIAIDHK